MQLGNFIDVFLPRHVSGTYAHHQENSMLNCSIWFSAPSFWMGGGLESRCVGRVYGADGWHFNLFHQIANTKRTENKTTDVVIQQYSRKLLMMDILMSEIC